MLLTVGLVVLALAAGFGGGMLYARPRKASPRDLDGIGEATGALSRPAAVVERQAPLVPRAPHVDSRSGVVRVARGRRS